MPNKRLVILVSGSGSNLQALIDATHAGTLNATIAAVISNRADAFGLERASMAGIPTGFIDHKQFPDRAAFDTALQHMIDSYKPDAVIMAGFMRILTPDFVHHYTGRLLNIHPSLLPKYSGLHTHERAITAGDTVAGATVHFVSAELDAGPAIIQASVPVHENDTPDTLAKRVLAKEHVIYPMAVQWLCEGRIVCTGDTVLLDNNPLPLTGFHYSE